MFLKSAGKQQLESPHEERVSNALHSVEVELQKLTEIPWLYYILHPNEDAVRKMWPTSLLNADFVTIEFAKEIFKGE